MLPSGKRAKNARSISLPSLRQHYLVVMATSLDKLENKVQINYLHIKRFHVVKMLQKLVYYIRRYSTKCASFLTVSYLTFTNKLSTLDLLDRISRNFHRYSGIICAVNAHN